ncbi:hypothetical protein [Proteiniphilum sp.]|uniref:hypothetical protein n=1 Tax=Proteiniphilum sp. TaxID=1926877 RepID=UPI0033225DE4
MAKLRDDHIRWILDVDAKGVQKEIQTLSSNINRLKKENEELSVTTGKVQKALNANEKEMLKLEKAGQTMSDRYKSLIAITAGQNDIIARNTAKIRENDAAIKENNKNIDDVIKTMKIEDMTMSQLKQRYQELQKTMDNTSASLSPEAWKALAKEQEEVAKRMDIVKNTNKGLIAQLAGMNHPIGTAAKAVQGFGQALKALAANPVGAVIMILVGLFTALKKIIDSNEESVNALNRILAPLKLLFDGILFILQKLTVAFLNFIEKTLTGLSEMIERFPFLNKILGGINEKAKEAVQLEKDKQDLRLQERESLKRNAKLEAEISELRTEATRRDKYSAAQRLNMLNKAAAKEKEIADDKLAQAKESLRLLHIEAARTKNASLMADKIAEAESNLSRVQTEHNNKMREIESNTATAVRQMNNEAKEAMQNRIKEIDKTLDYEINQLKKSRMEGLITEKEYNDKVEQLTLEALQKKMNIKGQEKHQIIQYESQILDAQIKQQEEADAILLEELRKTHQEKLDIINSDRNTQLESLQETEKDQAIYALRAKEIEVNAAEARMAVIKQFSETLQQVEFNNVQNRKKAIEDNNKEILSAEKETLKAREQLQKQFARTTADFERQYNIKTWEQRMDDEKRIIDKNYQDNYISAETHRLALAAIDKKYEDEKLKAREQYGLASMAELYNAEMDALLEQHEKGLLEEEEFEKAKLQIKLKYAQEYAQRAAEFASMAGDAISALMSAETANVEARYDAEIQAAGDNAEEVERLENEKAKKKLDIEKKYADVQFAVTAAEIISNTASAIMRTYAQLGWPAGAVAGALMGITGAAQLAVANTQRQKVKQMSLSGSSSDSGVPKTGQIKLKEGFADGGANMGDHTDGGYTGQGNRYDVAGWVPYHHGEYFVAVPEMKDPVVMDHVRAIDKIRRKRTTKNALPPGFADGGANMPSPGSSSGSDTGAIDSSIARQLLGVLNDLRSGHVRVNYGITEMEAAQKEKVEYESKFDLK